MDQQEAEQQEGVAGGADCKYAWRICGGEGRSDQTRTNVLDDAFPVGELLVARPEGLAVRGHLLLRLAVHLPSDVRQRLAPVLQPPPKVMSAATDAQAS